MRAILALIVASLCATAALADTAESSDPRIQSGMNEIKSNAALLAQARACHWLMHLDEVALTHSMKINAARIRVIAGDKAGDAADLAAQSEPATDPCGSASDLDKQKQTLLVRFEMLDLSNALEIYGGKGLIDFGKSDAMRATETKRLKDMFFAGDGFRGYNQVWDRTTSNARTFIALICPERIQRLADKSRTCPPIADGTQQLLPVARAEVSAVEAFDAALDATVQAKAQQSPPSAR